MTVPTYDELREKLQHHLKAARGIGDAADAAGRDLTRAEYDTVAEHVKAARDLQPRVKQAHIDDRTKAALLGLGAAIGFDDADADGFTTLWGSKSEPSEARPGSSPWVKSTMQRIAKVTAATGGKALISGSLDVPSPVAPEITRMAEYPTRVLDLLVDRRSISDTNTYNFPRQTVRTNNAAPVADGAIKPVSTFTVADVEDRVRVLAHLSESVPERLLADHGELADFLEVELERGLMELLEKQVVSGSGVGENMTGILNTSGIVTQAFNSNMHTTLRKARTALSVLGEVPTAWLLNPADTEAIDLLREGADGGFLLATPPGNITGAMPVVESTAVPAGTALLADWRWVRLIVRQDATLDVDRSGALFETNQVRMRVEGRFGIALRRTTAFCKATLTL